MKKSTRDPVRHKRTKHRIYMRKKANWYLNPERVLGMFHFLEAFAFARDWCKGGPNDPTEDGWWYLELNRIKVLQWVLDCDARWWFVRYRSPAEDLQYINQKPAFELKVPAVRKWVRFPAYDPSTALEPNTLKVRSGTYVCLHALSRLAEFGRDRFFFLTQNKSETRKFHPGEHLKFYPGEMLYLYKDELKEIFPDMGLTIPDIRNTSYYVMQVLRNAQDTPIELRVYSSRYKPIFRVVLDFPDGYAPPVTDGSWWHDTYFLSSKLRRRLAGNPQPTAHPSLKAA